MEIKTKYNVGESVYIIEQTAHGFYKNLVKKKIYGIICRTFKRTQEIRYIFKTNTTMETHIHEDYVFRKKADAKKYIEEHNDY